MNKERLAYLERQRPKLLMGEELDWLIAFAKEQAERVQELENLIASHAPHGRNYTNEQYVDLLQQNKRYRAILDDILEHAGTYGLRNLEKVELRKSIKWAESEEE